MFTFFKNIHFQKWDVAGDPRFRTLTSSYMRGASGIIFVYDITSMVSFEAITNWLQWTQSLGSTKILVGNKCDLEHLRQVDLDLAKVNTT